MLWKNEVCYGRTYWYNKTNGRCFALLTASLANGNSAHNIVPLVFLFSFSTFELLSPFLFIFSLILFYFICVCSCVRFRFGNDRKEQQLLNRFWEVLNAIDSGLWYEYRAWWYIIRINEKWKHSSILKDLALFLNVL